MKKLIGLLVIFILFFLLTSCWEKNDDINIINNEIDNHNSDNIKSNSWILEENENTTKQEILNNKKLIMKNNNVFLQEEWKDNIALTTRATGETFEDLKRWIWVKHWDKTIYSYKIIADEWNYWLVKREWYWWNYDNWEFYWIPENFYIIDFNENIDELTLIETQNYLTDLDLTVRIKWDNIELIPSSDNNWINIVPDWNFWGRGDIEYSLLKENWFKQVWNEWIKYIKISDIIKEEKEVNNNIKLDAKYSNDNLIKEWYKLNNLWSIKEYYKEVITPESIEYWKWFTTRKTIYIEWNKVLDFEVNNWWWQNLIIHNPEIKEVIDLSQYSYPIQAIFIKWDWSKIIISDLDTIKLIDKSNWINKVIWER